jgi:hypothetical protein
MKTFEDLPPNVRALIFATLSKEMSGHRAATIYHLAKLWETDVAGVWRNICRKAGQPACTIPVELLSSHRRQVVNSPQGSPH